MAVRPWRFGPVVVVSMQVGRVPRVFGVIHRRRLLGTAVPLGGYGFRGFRGGGRSLRRLRGQFLDVRQSRPALDKLVKIGLGEIWGIGAARLAPTTDGGWGAHSGARQPVGAKDDERRSWAVKIR